MKIAISILTIKDDLHKINQIDQMNTDYIHLDVMDGIFVENRSSFENIEGLKKALDIHFMVRDVRPYIEQYKHLNPEYMTFHVEVVEDVLAMIHFIRSNHIKAGICINPETSIDKIIPYLGAIDLVLVMSVHPGYGGQTFIENAVEKISELKKIKENNHYSYKIEVDGGINIETCTKCSSADILVVGSYITDTSSSSIHLQNIKDKFI